MLPKLIFATNNAHKVAEIQSAVGSAIEVITMREAGIDQDIPEPFPTLRENAETKAQTIARLSGLPCFGEDTGLEVDELNGAPGVKSARYAGEPQDAAANVQKLLAELGTSENRAACFRTVIALVMDGECHFFEGICTGHITLSPRGTEGFGYDPVFIPDGSEQTFAEMGLEEKNRYSHRKKAADALVLFLQDRIKNFPSSGIK